MKRLIWFAAPLVLAFGALAGGGTSVLAAGPPAAPPGQGPCSHGNSGTDCRPDPSPNGQDCDAHGKDDVGGMNEDHCLGASTPTTPTTPTTPITPTTPTTPTIPVTPTTSTALPPTTTESVETPTSSTTPPQALPSSPGPFRPPSSGSAVATTRPARTTNTPASDVAGVLVSRKAQPKVPSVLPFTP
jgi:hypothetical protein